jgi:outer membrane protein OmpA-like peptidoglycan-associated protein
MILPPIDIAVVIRDVNASNEAVEDQCLRARQAADIATRSARTADEAAAAAMRAEVAHRTVQAERPPRRAPLPRQVFLALITVALDGLACYFAAQALDGSQDSTLIWTGLFLGVLAGGGFVLDFYKDRNERTWHALVVLIGIFVTLLGTLRFWFLATIGGGALVPAIVGAFLFTGATAGFLSLGYRALRVAETPHAWRARRRARKARQAAWAARTAADRDAAERDRLIDAYLGHVRREVQKTCPLEQQLETEAAVREHLSGRRPLMNPRHVPALVRFVVVLGVLLTTLSGCRVTFSHPPTMRRLSLPAVRTSVLVIIANPDSALAMLAAGALAMNSVRPGERLLILDAQDGAVLASSQAPPSPSIQIAGPPAALPAHPTSFQKARHAQAVQQYQKAVLRNTASLRRQQQEGLAAWAKSVIAMADAGAILQSSQTVSISADLTAATSDLFSLRQAGLGYGPGTVVAIMGVDRTTARFTPTLPSGLQASSVVVDDFPGSIDEQAAWQSSLMQGGAARVVVLTPATEDQLVPVVQQGLDGAVTDTLTSVLFALGRYELQAAALPQMRRLLYLLTVKYPHATVIINGYTDNLPVPGGNLRLSQLRAQEVEEWLIAHGVVAGRLQAFGYGDTDPVAPNTAHGQPLNRRVVIVIDPATAAAVS